MGISTGVLTGTKGIARIITVVIGVVTLALIAEQYVKIAKEEFFLAMVIICFIFSVLWILANMFELIKPTEVTNKLDIGFHVIGGLLLIVAAICWFVSIADIENFICKRHLACPSFTQTRRLIGGIFGLLNGLIYIAIGGILFKD